MNANKYWMLNINVAIPNARPETIITKKILRRILQQYNVVLHLGLSTISVVPLALTISEAHQDVPGPLLYSFSTLYSHRETQ
ncbi:hypothetical protein CYLTODRAFT_416986 [Cylindrobasidium torrendii FP15055 ss-10]|uniref:Uncharacterized protein n=1 Tax=Cylindrobasidium torrendii FP15055 ss-10 TaxID=1314674 RepID=A0A0D7BTM8_9AGAR|nr:hypothetical protein CYLTODRAFT_416986 [Cylindrobasidium torrendii FP15055 ss-10]